ncbi:hypothetical protein GCM10010964_07950 [Caldovatus sediminis]|uniref:Uncharacterized protein n=1 Tax=Caldovatus sediminis TaxID=2041189 RepID=A0A8J2Z8T1_9PROT|nr:hypothetical protein [Caldovatus sediminis]GGG22201.1 hypothetical protein GCM10010964_07950 [Caldovatus sediminis]
MPEANALLPLLLLLATALAMAAALYMLKRGSGARRGREDTLRVLGLDARAAPERGAPPPVDLSEPIVSEAQWRAIRDHASDPAYRRAVEAVRLRYQLAGNPMLLPNTLRETMARSGLGFREAMLRVAEDDGLR